ncbi:MAG: hypothetical protein UHN02_03875 [Acutalibacteraceae bacterium]|nr:hypothetical protein [Acutalibacteraceae bacterium]
MLKGVNRKIIEINNTNSKYFEKAILFVSDDFTGESDENLQKQAQIAVDFFAGKFFYKKKKSAKFKIVLVSVFSAIIAGVVTLICFL